MKLRDLISVVKSSKVFVYSTSSPSNGYNSCLLLTIDIYLTKFGKVCLYDRDRTYYDLYENHDVVSIFDSIYGIQVYVEAPDHDKV